MRTPLQTILVSTHAIAALAALATALSAAPALAVSSCQFNVSVTNVSLLWNLSFPTQPLPITVTKQGAAACDYVITFSRGAAASYNRAMALGGAKLPYQLFKESSLTNVLKELPDAVGLGDAVTGSLPAGAGKSRSHTYYLQIPYNQATQPKLKPAGLYNDTYVVKIYPGSLSSVSSGAVAPDGVASVNLATNVPRLIQLSLVPSGSSFDAGCTTQNMSFGTLAPGASQGFDLRVLSNAGYSVSFSSQNNGVLRAASGAIKTTVPYTLSVNGSAVNLAASSSSPVTVTIAAGQTGLEGAVNPVNITIGATSGAMAGTYSDYITVTTATIE